MSLLKKEQFTDGVLQIQSASAGNMDREHLQTENRSEVGGAVPAPNPRPTRPSQEGFKLEAI